MHERSATPVQSAPERRFAQRLTGPRAVITEAGLAVSFILAACGSNNATETTNPTILPTDSPAPTIVVTPTPETTPTPTPEVSPTPSPTETVKPVSPITPDSVLKQVKAYLAGDKHALDDYKESISISELTNAYAAFKASPSIDLLHLGTALANLDRVFKNCTNPNYGIPQQDEAAIIISCSGLINMAAKAADLSGGDPAAVTFAKDMLRFYINKPLKTLAASQDKFPVLIEVLTPSE
jgi:hypothetical protein